MTDHEQELGNDPGVAERSLRDVRAERLLSIRELAQRAGVAPSTIFLLESGRTTPRRSIVLRLAAALGVRPQSISEFRRALRGRSEPR
jgi:transcriptional regulator with XRE-family HTH domain